MCETNDPIHFNEKIDEKFLDKDEIDKRISNGQDIIGRDNSFARIKLDNSFPRYLLENLDIYKNWIIN